MDKITADIKLIDDKLIVSGVIGFSTVPKLQKIGYHFIRKLTKPSFNFKQAQIEDSSGMALLVEWKKFANKQHKPIKFTYLPARLKNMAKLSDLETVLSDK